MVIKRRKQPCDHLPGSRSAYQSLQLGTEAPLCEPQLVCLGCGLRSPTLEQHGAAHPAGGGGHECKVVLDTQSAELYCTACGDYVYDQEYDSLRLAVRSASCPAIAGGGAHDEQGASVPHAGIAAPAATQFLGSHAAATPPPPPGTFQPVADDGFPVGLRGLNNMGNTCFMSSVLQGLLHAPLLRNYYLLGRHCKQDCAITADGGFCVSCELDEVFNEAYSGVRTAYSPAQFLYTWWMLAGSHLGSYQQHDAHEFFLFVLEMLNTSPGAGAISSQVFGGTLRSDVICASCGHASTTQDPFTHLSLDIPPRERLIPAPILPRPTNNTGAAAAAAAVGKAAAPVGRAGIKLSGAAAASKAAANARRNAQGAAAAAAAAEPCARAPTPAPSSSADHCTSSDVDAFDEAAGSTFAGGGQHGGGGAQADAMSQLEAASAVGGPGAALVDDSEDAAQDTLSSPRMSAAVAAAGRAARGQGAVKGAARGRPPIPKSGRGGAKKSTAAKPAGGGRRQNTGGEAEPGPGTLAMLGGPNGEGSDTAMATQDALGAASNLPGSQSTAAVGWGAGGAAMPPQLAGYQRWPAASLLGCLHRFVRQEELGTADVECTRCRSRRAIKQLSLRALPPVLVLHAKRFEHPGGLRAAARKLETDLAFPLRGLDMRPFLSSSVLRARHGLRPRVPEPPGAASTTPASSPPHRSPSQRSVRGTPGNGGRGGSAKRGSGGGMEQGSPPGVASAAAAGAGGEAGPSSQQQQQQQLIPPSPAAEDFLYDLYAVVCHRGSFNGGHYVAYVRGGDGRWYLCDDAWVVGVEEGVVQAAQAYMLFYARRGLLHH